MLTAEEIEAAALQLPKAEPRALVDRLLERRAAVRSISPAVLDETERRADRIYAGRAPTTPLDELLTGLDRDL